MNKKKKSAQKIMRFRKSEINLHWALAIPFMICYATALALVIIFNPDPSHPYRAIVSWIHRISGVCLVIFPLIAAIKKSHDFRIHFHNIKQAWTWSLSDIKWLCLMGLAAVSKKIKLPEQGKFNAAEKLNFMTLTATYPLYIITGILIWVTNGLLLSWLIHFGMAIIATPFIIGHLFMAMVNPSSRVALSGMFSGFVDPAFVKHHHTKWYNENFKEAVEIITPDVKSNPQPLEESPEGSQAIPV